LKNYLYSHVHCSIIHKSWNTEATWLLIDRVSDKGNCGTYMNGVLVKKEGNLEPGGHYAK
jgi:acyl-coenzyme A synthetase/AMP-(fatty) acid ligase